MEIDPVFYERWAIEFNNAANSVASRESELLAVADKIETNLELLGASAIEDKLQDGVPETISTLMEAEIKVWMLTGLLLLLDWIGSCCF